MVTGRSSRRALLRNVAAAGLFGLAGCRARDPDPSVSVPAAALTDEPVRTRVAGLDGHSSIRLRATSHSRAGERWESHARFDVSDTDVLSVADRAPIEGTYGRTDPMGLFWSQRPAGAAPDERLPPEALFLPPASGYDVTLTAEADGETLTEATTRRRLYDPDVERVPVDHPGLVGECFAPPGDSGPAVVHLHGVGGRPHVAKARLLASRGFTALALQYVGDPEPLPDALVEVPVEYAETAIEWLRGHDRVAGPAVGLFGFSRGATLALLAATRSDAVGAVAGWVPSDVVWEGLGPGRTPADTSAWSIDGEPVPYLHLAEADPGPPPVPGLPYFEPARSGASEAALEAATIPVETADAPILLESVTDDRRWPSTEMSEAVVERLGNHDYPHRYRHRSHGGAGHYVRLPYLPTAGTARDRVNVYGGSPAANALASSRSWSDTVSFLDGTIGDGSGRSRGSGRD